MYAIWPKIILGWNCQRLAQVRSRTVGEETIDTLIQTFTRGEAEQKTYKRNVFTEGKQEYSIVLELYCCRIDN